MYIVLVSSVVVLIFESLCRKMFETYHGTWDNSLGVIDIEMPELVWWSRARQGLGLRYHESKLVLWLTYASVIRLKVVIWSWREGEVDEVYCTLIFFFLLSRDPGLVFYLCCTCLIVNTLGEIFLMWKWLAQIRRYSFWFSIF